MEEEQLEHDLEMDANERDDAIDAFIAKTEYNRRVAKKKEDDDDKKGKKER